MWRMEDDVAGSICQALVVGGSILMDGGQSLTPAKLVLEDCEAGGLLKSGIRPTLNLLLLLLLLLLSSASSSSSSSGEFIENKHPTDVESPPPPPRVCKSINPQCKSSIHPQCKSCVSDVGRVLVLDDPSARFATRTPHSLAARLRRLEPRTSRSRGR